MGRDSAAQRQMTLVAFLQAANCSNYAASWRHPATAPDFLTAAYFQRIARTLEEGKGRVLRSGRHDFITATQDASRLTNNPIPMSCIS